MIDPKIPDDLTLYILMRTDMDSLNPGKAMAQAAHAQAALTTEITQGLSQLSLDYYLKWSRQTNQGFGRTVVLGGSKREIYIVLKSVEARKQDERFVHGWVTDPTYPINGGVETVPMDTCAFLLASSVLMLNSYGMLRRHP